MRERAPGPADGTHRRGAPDEPATDEPATDEPATDEPATDEPSVEEVARAALNRVRAAATAQGVRAGRRPASRRARPRPAGGRGGAAGPDARDPQPLGALVEGVVSDRGWSEPVAVGGVFGRWASVVGADVAAHCRPERFQDGALVVRADSTAWATQVRLLQARLRGRLDDELGAGVVTSLVVRGPDAPSWRRGRWCVSDMRGPRDTYG